MPPLKIVGVTPHNYVSVIKREINQPPLKEPPRNLWRNLWVPQNPLENGWSRGFCMLFVLNYVLI